MEILLDCIKKNYKKIIAIALVLILLVSSCCIYFLVPGVRKLSIKVYENDVIKTTYGWGTSACWWSQNIDDSETRTDIAKLLYSKDGLGLNIYRYNIGAGFDEKERTANPWRRAESFYYLNPETNNWEYDFSRDKNAYSFLKESISYGCIDTVVLFANSPHYSFTESGMASGSLKDNTCNLRKEYYKDYVDYLLTIAEHFLSDGIPVKYISPINEPQWSWGGEWVGQEGCHYEIDEAINLLRELAKGIKERNLDIKIMAPESGELAGVTKEYFDKIKNDEIIYPYLGSLAYHSYWTDNYVKLKEDFAETVDNEYSDIRVDMTEWCELPCWHDVSDVNSAVVMARVIANDMQLSHSSSWTSWVAVNQNGINEEDHKNYSDGLITANDDISSYEIAARYYALAHFSKYIPTESQLIKSKVNMSTLTSEIDWNIEDENDPKREKTNYSLSYAAFKTPDEKIVLVLVNEGDTRDIRISVKADNMTVIRTDDNNTLSEIYSGKKKSIIEVPNNSITTVIYS